MRIPFLPRLFKTRHAPLPVITPYVKQEPRLDEAAIAALCPHIRAILDAELTAGNTIETGGFSDWPRPNSIILSMHRLFVHTYPDHYPVTDPVFYSMFDPKIGDGDSYFCTEHSHLLFAPMPTQQSLGWSK